MADIVSILSKETAYTHPVSKIKVVETHVSWVFLTGKYAYKVKKPVNFGFLDYSTLERRKRFCEEELRINSRFSDMYVDVVPVGSEGIGKGEIVDYAVKMLQMPEESIMTGMLADGKITGTVMEKIADIITAFHKRNIADKRDSLTGIKLNWEENFLQTKDALNAESLGYIKARIERFLHDNEMLLKSRAAIRCHGDLHSGNIFIVEGTPYIFDAIEFNDRIAFCDPVLDIAFMAMDLEFHGRKDLADIFISSCQQEISTGLLTFYKCYRAYVRGKIAVFSKKPEEAAKYFLLAESYAKIL
ncbi:MAG: phosphotransferase [Candidatus Aenigmarchaeota archaeon]|nr:phosphotransferase [Candidatus Aenigmarchaeota archaeon]